PENPDNPLDQWILSEAEKLVLEVTNQLESYELQKAIAPILNFIDLLNNWYIRRSRRRFWRSENDSDKLQAYETLYSVLMKLITVAAPFIPFITEEIYMNLKTEGTPDSIHLGSWPEYNESIRNLELEMKMALTRQAVSMGRALRSMHSLKTRQPLKALHLVTRDEKEKLVLQEMADIIAEELNVKEVIFKDNEEDLVEYSAKANFKVLGKQLGPNMKTAAAAIAELKPSEIQSLIEGATLSLDLSFGTLEITEESVVIQRSEKANMKVLNEGSLTVALDSELTEELVQEGIVRDIVRSVQNLRKEKDLDVSDRIVLFVSGSEKIKDSVKAFQDYLSTETLTDKWTWENNEDAQKVECGGEECFIAIQKA
ncbi:MAG: DUF5915 domain-containing protein, partial [Spirochaetales bacterium]|nr:DUF5915 domain-containing protein [Spirochaetales bacterium]